MSDQDKNTGHLTSDQQSLDKRVHKSEATSQEIPQDSLRLQIAQRRYYRPQTNLGMMTMTHIQLADSEIP
jgi:hypothetical protein